MVVSLIHLFLGTILSVFKKLPPTCIVLGATPYLHLACQTSPPTLTFFFHWWCRASNS